MPDLTISEAAQVMRVSQRTIRRWIAMGLLPAVRVGPWLIRIDADDLARLGRPIPSARPREVRPDEPADRPSRDAAVPRNRGRP